MKLPVFVYGWVPPDAVIATIPAPPLHAMLVLILELAISKAGSEITTVAVFEQPVMSVTVTV